MKSSDLFSQYFLDCYKLTGLEELQIEYVSPITLITRERFDLVCKIFYIECREKQQNIELAKDLYKEHIRCITLGSYKEPDSATKNDIDSFFNEFDELIDSIKKNGFDKRKSIVPVGSNSSILNGSHRTAVCYYFGIDLPIVKINSHSEIYDYNFFKKQEMDEKYLDIIASLFVKYCNQSYICFLWPVISKHDLFPAADKLITNTNSVVYKKEIKLNFRGMVQLMMQLYGHQEWTGGFEEQFRYVIPKAINCYSDNGLVIVYVLCNLSLDSITKLKSDCRCLFEIDKHSMHITDTKEEAQMASEIVLNKNSIFLLNNGYIFLNNFFVNSCESFLGYYDNYSFSKGVSDLFFQNKEHISESAVLHFISESSIYKDWFGSMYCFGKRLPFNIENVSKVDSPYESMWKMEKRKQLFCKIRNSYTYKILRKIKRTLIKGKKTKPVIDIQHAFNLLLVKKCNYLILRNFEGYFDDLLVDGHNDVDVLVYSERDRKILLSTFHAVPRWSKDDGHAYKFIFLGKWIDLDIRMVGDNYYDSNWQKNMLKNKVLTDKKFYVMDETNLNYSLAYHALYQKKYLPPDYEALLMNRFKDVADMNDVKQRLRLFMDTNNYFYCYPLDSSVVCYFDKYCKARLLEK